MANLENLNFEVILKDDTFKKQIAQVQAMADKFNISMSAALSLSGVKGGAANVKEVVKALNEATAAQKNLNAAIKASPAEKITIRHRDAVAATNQKMFDTARLLRTIGTLTGGAFSIYGIRRFLSSLIDITGQFEVQKMALRTMLQDIDAADKIFQDLYRFSSDSTYRFSELAKYSKQLAAFNIGKDNLLETTKMLGDVASGVGVSMDRLILAYGHVKSSGFLRGIQLRSFSQNGVPILDELAKMFTEIEGKAISLGEVFDKMTRREIPFEMVEEAFRRMTSEGGQFYQMQEVLSKTLAGQINILKGRWENLMYAVGESQDGMLKGAVSSISNLIADYDRFGQTVKNLIITFGIYKATVLAVEIATNTFALANHRLVAALVRVGKWMLANPYTLLAAGIAAATFAILQHSSALSESEKQQKNINKAVNDYNAAVASETTMLDYLFRALHKAKVGTQEYDDAKAAIIKRFGDNLTAIDRENLALGESIKVYSNLKTAIENVNKEKFREQGLSDITADYNNRIGKVQSALERKIGKKFGRDEQQIISDYVYGRGVENIAEVPRELFKKIANAGLTMDLQRLRAEYVVAGNAMTEAMEKLDEQFQITFGKEEGPSVKPGDPRIWVKSVNKEINKLDPDILKATELTPKQDEDYYEYLDRIGKKFKELNEEKDKALTADKPRYENWLSAINKVDAALEGNILSDARYTKTPWRGNTSSSDTETRQQIQKINKQASLLQKYKDVYDTLRPFLGEENMASALGNIFGVKFEDTDFDTELDRLIVKLSELGEEGEQAAESLRASLGKDTASQLKKSLEAQDKAAEMLRDYLEKDFGVEGAGVAAQISKLLVDLTNKNLKADDGLAKFIQQLDKAEVAKKLEYIADNFNGAAPDAEAQKVRERYADEYWQKWRKAQIDAYKEQLKLEKQANEKLTNEQIVGKADDIFKMLTQTEGIDLTNWNDKTISQLRQIRAELLSLEIPQEILDMLDPETQALLQKAFDAIRGGEITKSDKVVSEKNVKAAQKLLNAFQGIGAAITEMGDAMGNDILSGVGQILSMAEEITSVLAENETLMQAISGATSDVEEGATDIMKSADWITMIVKLVLIFIKQFAGAIADDEARIRALVDSAREARDMLYDQQLASGVDSIFGKNFIQQIENAKKNIDELDKAMAQMRTTWEASGFLWSASGSRLMSANDKQTAFNNTILGEKTGLFGLGKVRNFSLADAARELGFSDQIFDAYGNINAALLEAIKNTYNLDSTSAAWVENQIMYVEKYKEAMGVVEDTMDSVFGDIAASAADTIIDRWIEAGDAALDYADILDDVAKSYAKMLIQSSILDNVLNEDEVKRVMQMFVGGDYEGAMAAIAGDMEQIAGMEPVFQQILEAFDPYFNKEGSDGTLANGIKGITEDTANLLASYLNAIRADVSFLRAMAQQGWANVESITASLAVLPSLADYMVRIEAHNANTAENTQQILNELRSVIINEGSGRGFRSYPA